MLRSLGINKSFLETASRKVIEQAFYILETIEELLLNDQSSKAETEKFLNLIPMVGEFNKSAYSLDDVQKLKEIIASISAFGGSAEILRSVSSSNSNDELYKKLGVKLTRIEKNAPIFSHIERAIKNTQSVEYPDFTVNVLDIFEAERPSEQEPFSKYKSLPNHRLLWHGSRLSNFIGILTNGLKIAPSAAPLHGEFLGKGIYLADMASKSAFYCHATHSSKTMFF